MQRIVDEWITASDRSQSEIARWSGVSRSTIHRIRRGQVDPSWGTLHEIALACGVDAAVTTEPLSDPDAAAAARHLLDSHFSGASTAGRRAWIARFERRGASDPLSILRLAGRAAAPRHRRGGILLRGEATAARLASAGDASRSEWALSGRPALGLSALGLEGPSVLWSDAPELVARLLADTHPVRATPSTVGVVILPASDGVFADAFDLEGIRFVAPIQFLLDGIGLGGDLATAALEEASRW